MGTFSSKVFVPNRSSLTDARPAHHWVRLRRRSWFSRHLMLTAAFTLMLSGLGIAFTAPLAYAQSSSLSAVSSVNASPSLITAGSTSNYTVTFSATSGLASGTTITLSGSPTGPIFPPTAGDYTVNGTTVIAQPT